MSRHHYPLFTKNYHLIALLGVLLIFQSCYKKEGTSGALTFSLKPESGIVSAMQGQYQLEIKGEAQWHIQTNASWIKAEPGFGSGDAIVFISVDANSGSERMAKITISTADKTWYQEILQEEGNSNGGDNGNSGNTGLGDISKRIEVPMLNRSNDDLFIAHTTEYNGKVVANYSLEYVKSKQHARWVAFAYYHETAGNNTARTNAWDDDPQVPAEYRSQRNDYPYPPYDRGHIVASSDRVYSREANEQTFYYSNITPQYSHFNRNIWTQFEGVVRNWGRSDAFRDTLYVVKGGTIDDRIIEYTRPNNIVPVPKYFYMALVNYKDQQYHGIAFWIEHRKDYNENNLSVSDYAISIDELEAKTGIDFFPNLPDEMENKVESRLDKSRWGGM